MQEKVAERIIRGRAESMLEPEERFSAGSTCLVGRRPMDSALLGVFVAIVVWITFVGVWHFWLHRSAPFGPAAALLLAILVATRASSQYVVAVTDRRVIFFVQRWPVTMAREVWLIHALAGSTVVDSHRGRVWSELRYRDPEGVERSLHFLGRGRCQRIAAALAGPFSL